jgi:hypothetical protein
MLKEFREPTSRGGADERQLATADELRWEFAKTQTILREKAAPSVRSEKRVTDE